MTKAGRPTISEQKDFWDWHWRHGEERRTVNTWKDRRHAAIRDYLEALSLDRPEILDVGCGTGFYTRSLAEFGPTTGIDLSPESISRAAQQFPEVTFYAGNYYEFSLPDAHFDVVVAQEVIEHVEDQPAFVARTARLLKPHGHFLFSCTNKLVMGRLREGFFPEQPPQHIADHLDLRGIRRLLAPTFRVARWTSVISLGELGVLRWVNSTKLNALLAALISPAPPRGAQGEARALLPVHRARGEAVNWRPPTMWAGR